MNYFFLILYFWLRDLYYWFITRNFPYLLFYPMAAGSRYFFLTWHTHRNVLNSILTDRLSPNREPSRQPTTHRPPYHFFFKLTSYCCLLLYVGTYKVVIIIIKVTIYDKIKSCLSIPRCDHYLTRTELFHNNRVYHYTERDA